MVYKTTFSFTSTPRIPKLTVVCGPYRYELKDAEGEFVTPVYTGSPCELDRRIGISHDPYDEEDDKMATVLYTVSVVGIPPGGLDDETKVSGGIGGSVDVPSFTIEDIIIYPSGFFPIYGSDPEYSTERLNLYGWTIPNFQAYINDDTSKYYTGNIYTDTETPTTTSKLYLKDGTEINHIQASAGASMGDWYSSDGITVNSGNISFTCTE